MSSPWSDRGSAAAILLVQYAWGLRPVDIRAGIHDRTVRAGGRRLTCTLRIIHDFMQAAEDLLTVAGIRVSPERLRQIVEVEGRQIMEARSSGAFW